jgi:hypothetical protein
MKEEDMAKKVVKYEIFTGIMFEQAAFEERVSHAMGDGWRPAGGVAVVCRGTGSANYSFYQAMTLERVKREGKG